MKVPLEKSGNTDYNPDPLKDLKNGTSQYLPGFPYVVMGSFWGGGIHLLDSFRGVWEGAGEFGGWVMRLEGRRP